MKTFFIGTVAAVVLAGGLFAGDFQVVFETTSCNGELGFAAAEIENVYKIEEAACTAPGKPGEKLKKLLVKNGKGSYDTFTLTAAEAKNVIADMKAYQRARLKNLENANTLILSK